MQHTLTEVHSVLDNYFGYTQTYYFETQIFKIVIFVLVKWTKHNLTFFLHKRRLKHAIENGYIYGDANDY